jgi:protein-S-isoprenylcysteine O-methyltransferase Ste14
MNSRYKSFILVWLQFLFIVLLLMQIPTLHCDLWAFIVSAFGLFLGFWAVVSMRLDNLSVTPDVRRDARLVTSGPYKVIRHPMYSAVLLMFLPFILDRPRFDLTIIYLLLVTTLFVKLNYEEGLLKNHFTDYEAYSTNTWRLIPFIY